MDLGFSYFLGVQCRVLDGGSTWQSPEYKKPQRKVFRWNLWSTIWSVGVNWWSKVDYCGQAPGHCLLRLAFLGSRSYLHSSNTTRIHLHKCHLLQTSCSPTIKRHQDNIQVVSPNHGIDSLRLCRKRPVSHESRPLKSCPRAMWQPNSTFLLGFSFLGVLLDPWLRHPSAAVWKENDDLGRRHGDPNEQDRRNAVHALRNHRHNCPASLRQH